MKIEAQVELSLKRSGMGLTLADNETQASETECPEACWTNYTRRVAPW